jgi:hypothetical protein
MQDACVLCYRNDRYGRARYGLSQLIEFSEFYAFKTGIWLPISYGKDRKICYLRKTCISRIQLYLICISYLDYPHQRQLTERQLLNKYVSR